MEALSVKMVGVLLLVSLVAGILGATLAIIWDRRRTNSNTSNGEKPRPDSSESPRQEARRYYLLNETNNVLISTSLSPEGRLPDATLELFSEALAHMACIFYAVSGSKDPVTDEPFSLYNYSALKRALEWEPTFIRVSTGEPPVDTGRLRTSAPPSEELSAEKNTQTVSAQQDENYWLDQHVKHTSSALGIEESPRNINRLRAIHTQMRAEAKRIQERRATVTLKAQVNSESLKAPQPSDSDYWEVGFITLYCECLMGVSLVSVKLWHANSEEYIREQKSMEQDTYLFVSPSQLKKATQNLNALPRVDMEH